MADLRGQAAEYIAIHPALFEALGNTRLLLSHEELMIRIMVAEAEEGYTRALAEVNYLVNQLNGYVHFQNEEYAAQNSHMTLPIWPREFLLLPPLAAFLASEHELVRARGECRTARQALSNYILARERTESADWEEALRTRQELADMNEMIRSGQVAAAAPEDYKIKHSFHLL